MRGCIYFVKWSEYSNLMVHWNQVQLWFIEIKCSLHQQSWHRLLLAMAIVLWVDAENSGFVMGMVGNSLNNCPGRNQKLD